MAKRILPMFGDPKSKKILKGLCEKHNLSIEFLNQMIEIQRDNLGRQRQIGITQEFSAAIAEFIDTNERGEL
jgi:hypothetical protein